MTKLSAPLSEVCTFRHGGTPTKSNPKYWGGDIPWVSPKDMKTTLLRGAQDSITQLGVDESATSLVPSGTILTVVRSGILAHSVPFAIAERPLTFNQDIKAIQVSDSRITSDYVYWFLRSKEPEILSRGVKKGATVHSLQSGYLESLPIPLLSTSEQARIVDLLSRAENIVRMRRAAEQKAKEIIPALFLDMFGDPGTNPSAVFSAGRLNRDRTGTLEATKLLGDLVDPERGITYGVVQRGDEYAGGVPVIRIGDFVENVWAPKDVVCTDPAISSKYSRTVLQGGEIVVSIRGTIGKAAIVPSSAAGWNVAREVAVVPILPGVSRYYIHAFLQSDTAQSFFLRETRGVAQRGINLEDLRNLTVPMPTPAKVARYEYFVTRLNHVVASQSAAEMLASSAFESLLKGVFGAAA